MTRIRPAEQTDVTAIWRIMEPTIRAEETYALDPTLSAADNGAGTERPRNRRVTG